MLLTLPLAAQEPPAPQPEADQDREAPGDLITTETSLGKVVGTETFLGGLSFRGIPYAEPPVGSLRFRAPKAKSPWPGILNAKEFGPACPQIADPLEGIPEELGALDNEDCLSINVWTPGLDEAARPVMVWIHGGSNVAGSSRSPLYDGSVLSARGDVVVVSFNYRLGLLGWLDVTQFGGQNYAGAANNGMRDQILALRWVQENIGAFGGNPNNVTVFGESAGSMAVSTLLTLARPERLFRAAILQSGVTFSTDLESAKAMAADFFERAAITESKQLREMATADLLAAQKRALDTYQGTDGDVIFVTRPIEEPLTATPFEAVRAGNAAQVSLVLGTTEDEMRYWLHYLPELRDTHPADLGLGLSPENLEALLLPYRENTQYSSAGDLSLALLSDLYFRMPTLLLAEAQAVHTPNVWHYLFARDIPRSDLGAAHAAELPFVFGTLGLRVAAPLTGLPLDHQERSQNAKLATAMQDLWLGLAISGDPNASANEALPLWSRYDAAERATLRIEDDFTVVSDPGAPMREAWLAGYGRELLRQVFGPGLFAASPGESSEPSAGGDNVP